MNKQAYILYCNVENKPFATFLSGCIKEFSRKYGYRPTILRVNPSQFIKTGKIRVDTGKDVAVNYCKVGPLKMREPRQLKVARQPLEV